MLYQFWKSGRLVGVAGAIVAIGAVGAALAATPEWVELRDPDGLFSVSLPATPVAKAADGNAQVSDENARSYSLQADDETYLIHVSEVPTLAVWLAPLALLYDRARAHYIEESNVTETSFNEIRRFDRTGRALDFTEAPLAQGKGEGRVEFFLLEDHMLVFEAMVPSGGSRNNVNRFFESISFDGRTNDS
jgi:hypothetical protein